MSKSYSVADARAHLPDILDDVEAGKDVQLTRRGRAVALVLSPQRTQASQRAHNFGDAFRAFLGRHAPKEIGLEPDFFGSICDESRDVESDCDAQILARHDHHLCTHREDTQPRVVRKLEQQSESLRHCCASLARANLWLAVGFGREAEACFEEYLHAVVRRSFPILPYDDAAAEWHGRERAALERGEERRHSWMAKSQPSLTTRA